VVTEKCILHVQKPAPVILKILFWGSVVTVQLNKIFVCAQFCFFKHTPKFLQVARKQAFDSFGKLNAQLKCCILEYLETGNAERTVTASARHVFCINFYDTFIDLVIILKVKINPLIILDVIAVRLLVW